MDELMKAENWWALVERKGGDNELQYWPVIAWQLLEGSGPESKLVAWITGRDPIRSDRFDEHVFNQWTFLEFVRQLPENAREASWS